MLKAEVKEICRHKNVQALPGTRLLWCRWCGSLRRVEKGSRWMVPILLLRVAGAQQAVEKRGYVSGGALTMPGHPR